MSCRLFRGALPFRLIILVLVLGLVSLALFWVHPSQLSFLDNFHTPFVHGTPPPGSPAHVPGTDNDEKTLVKPGTWDGLAQDPEPKGASHTSAKPGSHGETDDAGDEDLSGARPDEPCTSYMDYSRFTHHPKSTGRFQLGYQRPPRHCRTFRSKIVEDKIKEMKGVIADPDMFRLFENTLPNTIDTAIRWHGKAANNSNEELTFIITGDINAMWLRDSANQLQAYRSLLTSKSDDIATLFRGTINLQARYIISAPFCNAFQPPPEAGISTGHGGGGSIVYPAFDASIVSTCNFELDSLAGFLQLSHDYYNATEDLDFFGRFQWVPAVQSLLATARAMSAPTYDEETGEPLPKPYSFNANTHSMTGTLGNVGTGNPVARTGMVRSPFRPSDDTGVFEFLVPANMMLARYLEATADIMALLQDSPTAQSFPAHNTVPAPDLAGEMRGMASEIREGIRNHAIIDDPSGNGAQMYAYEVDGFGGRNLMDDANLPSLLSAPFIGFLDRSDPIYNATRKFVLSERNPWYCSGPVINAVGGPHIKPGAAWPMAAVMDILTADDGPEGDELIILRLAELLSSTDGTGLMHESINAQSATDWTRQWFSWANGLYGQMILDLAERRPHLLKKSFQNYLIAWMDEQ